MRITRLWDARTDAYHDAQWLADEECTPVYVMHLAKEKKYKAVAVSERGKYEGEIKDILQPKNYVIFSSDVGIISRHTGFPKNRR